MPAPQVPARPDPASGIVASEFAAVEVRIDVTANGPRLRLEDLSGGRVAYLDALQLEALVWLPPERLAALLDPSAHRWRDDTTDEGGPERTR